MLCLFQENYNDFCERTLEMRCSAGFWRLIQKPTAAPLFFQKNLLLVYGRECNGDIKQPKIPSHYVIEKCNLQNKTSPAYSTLRFDTKNK